MELNEIKNQEIFKYKALMNTRISNWKFFFYTKYCALKEKNDFLALSHYMHSYTVLDLGTCSSFIHVDYKVSSCSWIACFKINIMT